MNTITEIRALVREYRQTCDPAPYTSERALIERLEAILDREGDQ